MSKAFIAQVIQESAQLTGAGANRAATDLMAAIVKELKKTGKFTLPSFGTFSVRKTKARKGLNRPLQGLADAQEGGLTGSVRGRRPPDWLDDHTSTSSTLRACSWMNWKRSSGFRPIRLSTT